MYINAVISSEIVSQIKHLKEAFSAKGDDIYHEISEKLYPKKKNVYNRITVFDLFPFPIFLLTVLIPKLSFLLQLINHYATI